MGLAGAHATANVLEAPLGAGMFVGTYSYPGPQSGLLGGSDTVTLHSTGRQRPQGGRCDIFLAPSRYGYILPHSEEDGGPLDQLKM